MATRARSTVPELEPVLRSLYRALAEDISFGRCLEVVATALRSHVSALHFEDFDAEQSKLEVIGSVGRDELVMLAHEYATRWQCQNPWLARGIGQLISKGYGDGDDVVTEAELLAMPYYQHYLRRVDVRHGLGICVWHDGPRKLVVATFNRAAAEGPFTPETMAFVAALHPHLVNAFAIYRRASLLEGSNLSLRGTMDRAPMGMMVLSVDGCVLHANGEAERLLDAHAGIARGKAGGLLFERCADNGQFQTMLRQLASDKHDALTHSLLITRSTRTAPPLLVLHLCALPSRMTGEPAARVIAFLCPLARAGSQRVDTLLLQSSLGLTPAEARVLIELRRHYDLKAAADALDVAPTTVRTHLKHAFAKTSTRKQSELLALVDRIVMLAPTGGGANPMERF